MSNVNKYSRQLASPCLVYIRTRRTLVRSLRFRCSFSLFLCLATLDVGCGCCCESLSVGVRCLCLLCACSSVRPNRRSFVCESLVRSSNASSLRRSASRVIFLKVYFCCFCFFFFFFISTSISCCLWRAFL